MYRLDGSDGGKNGPLSDDPIFTVEWDMRIGTVKAGRVYKTSVS